MKIRHIICTTLFLILAVNCKSQKNISDPNEQFRGLWILDKYESYDSTSKKWVNEPSRMGYIGYILFDGQGHVAIQITPADYNEFDKKTDSVGIKIMTNYHSNNLIYFSDYKIEGNEIEQKVLSSTNPESIGAILRREFEVKGKTLLLTPKNRVGSARIRMKWVKVQ